MFSSRLLIHVLLEMYEMFQTFYHFLKQIIFFPIENQILYIQNFEVEDMKLNKSLILNTFINLELRENIPFIPYIHKKRKLYLSNVTYIRNKKIETLTFKNVSVDEIRSIIINMDFTKKYYLRKKYIYASLNNIDITNLFINRCWLFRPNELYPHELSLMYDIDLDSNLELTDSDTLDIQTIKPSEPITF